MENPKIDKSEIINFDYLKQYLISQAYSSKRLYHYTTFESLLSIINSKTLRLSRLDLLNDKAEQKIGRQNDMINSYVISFTKKKEYVSMWAMYGKACSIKLRLDFNTKIFIECIENLFCDSEKTKPIRKRGKELFNPSTESFDVIQLSDVAYLDKNKMTIKHNGGTITGLTVDDGLIEKLTGFVKYDAWEFEKETRLRVQLNKKIYTIGENPPPHIFCGISDELIKSFHITYNPWMNTLLKKEIKKSLDSLCGFDVPCNDSTDDGEISEL